MKVATYLSTASLLALVKAQSNTSDATVCASGAHVIVARASLESPGYGVLVTTKDQILARIPNSNAVAVPYPATIWGDILYIESEPEGVGNLTNLVKEYYDACPGHKMVLMGYSQGAQVVGDALIGSDYLNFGSFPNTTGLAQNYIDSIAAVVLMGDPANVAGQPFERGNSTLSGTFPRNNTAKWASTGLTDKVVAYCDANDTFCASGESVQVHLEYVEKYGSQAVDFVVERFMASNTTTTTSGSSPGSSGSATPTASSTSGAARLNTDLSLYVMVGGFQCILAFMALLAM